MRRRIVCLATATVATGFLGEQYGRRNTIAECLNPDNDNDKTKACPKSFIGKYIPKLFAQCGSTDINKLYMQLRDSKLIQDYNRLDLNIFCYTDYVACYDHRKRIPRWVFEHMTKDKLSRPRSWICERPQILPEDDIPPHFATNCCVYLKSPYAPGFLADPECYDYDEEVFKEFHKLTNIAPMDKDLYANQWQRLADHAKYLTKIDGNTNVYIFSGPLFVPIQDQSKKVIRYNLLNHSVAIPSHFFKVILVEGCDNTFQSHSYILENKPDSAVCITSLQDIEAKSGLDLFSDAERQKIKELAHKGY